MRFIGSATCLLYKTDAADEKVGVDLVNEREKCKKKGSKWVASESVRVMLMQTTYILSNDSPLNSKQLI